jgi:hypothetical protein
VPGYQPQHGDLVFFERRYANFLNAAIAAIDRPDEPFGISHVAIVDCSGADVAVIECTLHDDLDGVFRTPLAKVCRGSREMLVVQPAPTVNPESAVDEARRQIGCSEYSKVQLILSGVAAVLRLMPCDPRRMVLWDLVHRKSHAEAQRIARERPELSFSGTCSAMVSCAERACGGSQILEPDCADPVHAHRFDWVVYRTILGLGQAAGELSQEAGEEVRELLRAHELENLDWLADYLGGDGDDGEDLAGRVDFGAQAAGVMLKALVRAGMVWHDAHRSVYRHLRKTFAVVDQVVKTGDPSVVGHQHADPVFPPLMPLGLLLQQSGAAAVRYPPYGG